MPFRVDDRRRTRTSRGAKIDGSDDYPASVRQSDRRRPKTTALDRAAERVREAQARVHETANERATPAGVEAWHAAVDDLNAAMRQLYPPSFEEDIERVRQGAPVAFETAIGFLEADPWAFGTGYTKERILEDLKKATFSPKQAARLRAVILARVDGPQRREFRRYCLLAPRVVDDSLLEALLARLRSGEPGRARKALWVLDALGHSIEPGDEAVAREIIEEIAASPHAWRAANWLPEAVRRYRDPAWIERLFQRAGVAGKDGRMALRLIVWASIRPTNAQRAQLTEIVLTQVRAGNGVSRSLIELADGPDLRDGLLALDHELRDTNGSRDHVRRAIGWITRRSRGRWPVAET